jgi:uncharacterized protein
MVSRVAALLGWRTLALACLLLGAIGAFLPLLPTTPFLLVAAWAAGKGWPQFEAWLLAHPRHGPTIRRWRERRAVPLSAKWWAGTTMLVSVVLLAVSSAPLVLKWSTPALLAAVAVWLWRRPET